MSFVRPAQSGLSINVEPREAAAVLAEFPSPSGGPRIEPLAAHGGMSGADLWLVTSDRGRYVLRRWPAEHPTPGRLRFIHAVLAHAHEQGMAVLPVPLRTRSGETFLLRNGRLWELAPWLRGEANFDREPNDRKLAAALRALATFHLACANYVGPSDGLAGMGLARSPGLVDRARRLEELNRAMLDSLRQAVAQSPLRPSLDRLAGTMLDALPQTSAAARPQVRAAATSQLPLQPCLRDIWHGNVLFTGDEVSGIVDFGALRIDSPALDVARLLGSMAGDEADGWRRGLQVYEQLRPLTREEQVAMHAADASGTILGCVNWLQWLYVEGRRFPDLLPVELRMLNLAARLQIGRRTGFADTRQDR